MSHHHFEDKFRLCLHIDNQFHCQSTGIQVTPSPFPYVADQIYFLNFKLSKKQFPQRQATYRLVI